MAVQHDVIPSDRSVQTENRQVGAVIHLELLLRPLAACQNDQAHR